MQYDLRGRISSYNLNKISSDHDAEPNIGESGTNLCIETLKLEQGSGDDCPEKPSDMKSDVYRPDPLLKCCPIDSDTVMENMGQHMYVKISEKSYIKTLGCEDNKKEDGAEIPLSRKLEESEPCSKLSQSGDHGPCFRRWPARDNAEKTIETPSFSGNSTKSCMGKTKTDDVSEKSVAGSNEDSGDEMKNIERSLSGMSFRSAEFHSGRHDPEPKTYESGASPYIETPRLEHSKGEDRSENLLCMSSEGSDVENDTDVIKKIHISSVNVDTINFQTSEDVDSSVPSLEWSPVSSDNDSESFGVNVFIKTSTKSCIRTLKCTDNEKDHRADEKQETVDKRIYKTSTEACIRSLATEDSATVNLPGESSKTSLSISSGGSDVENEIVGIPNINSSISEFSPSSDYDSDSYGLHVFIETSTKSCIRTLRCDNNRKENCADDCPENNKEFDIERKDEVETVERPLNETPFTGAEFNSGRHDAEPKIYESGASPYIETPRLEHTEGEDWSENLLYMSSEGSDVESDNVGTKKMHRSSINVDTINFQSNEDGDSSVPSLEWSPVSSDSDSEKFGLHVFIKTSTKSCIRTLRSTDNKKEDCADEKQETIGKCIYKTSTEACIRSLTTEDRGTVDLPEKNLENLLGMSSEGSDVDSEILGIPNINSSISEFSPASSAYDSDSYGLHVFIETSTKSCIKTLRREDDGKDDCAPDEQGSVDKCINRTSTESCIKTLTTRDSERNNLSEKNPENLLSKSSEEFYVESGTIETPNIQISGSELNVDSMNFQSNEDSDSSAASMEWSPVDSDNDSESFGLHVFIKTSTKSCIRTLRCDNNGKEDCVDDCRESKMESDMEREDEVENIERPLTETQFTGAEFNSGHQEAEPRIEESGTNPCMETFIDTRNSRTHTGANSIKTPLEWSPLNSDEEGENSGLHVLIKTSTKSCIKTLRSEEDLEVEMLTRKFEERGDDSIAERIHRNITEACIKTITPEDSEENSDQSDIEDEKEVIRRLLNEMPLPSSDFYSGRKFYGTSTKQCIQTLKPEKGIRKPNARTEPKDETVKPDGDTVRPDSDKFKTVIERWYSNRSVNRTEEDKENVQLLWHERADGSLKCLVTDNCSYVSRTRQDLTTHVYNDHSSKHCTIT